MSGNVDDWVAQYGSGYVGSQGDVRDPTGDLRTWVPYYFADFTTESTGSLIPDFGGTHTFAGAAWTLSNLGTITTFEVNGTDGIRYSETTSADSVTMDIRLTDLIPDVDLENDQLWLRCNLGMHSGSVRGRNNGMRLAWEDDGGFGNASANPDMYANLGILNTVGTAGNDRVEQVLADGDGLFGADTEPVATLPDQLLSINTRGLDVFFKYQDASAGISPATPDDIATVYGSANGLGSMRMEEAMQQVDNTEAFIGFFFTANTSGTLNGHTLKSFELLRFE